jgi:putative membrane protein
MGLLLRTAINTLAILLAGALLPGIRVDSVLAALLGGLVLGVINAVVRPVLLVLTFPITLVTLGLFVLVLNGLCFWLAAALVPGVHVEGFWPAVGAALLVSAASWLASVFLADSGRIVVVSRRWR